MPYLSKTSLKIHGNVFTTDFRAMQSQSRSFRTRYEMIKNEMYFLSQEYITYCCHQEDVVVGSSKQVLNYVPSEEIW